MPGFIESIVKSLLVPCMRESLRWCMPRRSLIGVVRVNFGSRSDPTIGPTPAPGLQTDAQAGGRCAASDFLDGEISAAGGVERDIESSAGNRSGNGPSGRRMGFEDSRHVTQGFGRAAQIDDARGDAVGDSDASLANSLAAVQI